MQGIVALLFSCLLVPLATALPEYYQCGGLGWTGNTICDPGLACVIVSPYFSHCLRIPSTTTPPSPSVTSLVNRTSIASIYYRDPNGAHARVYYQDTAGYIRDIHFDQLTGWILPSNNIITRARERSPITVTSWSNGTSIRLFYLDDDDYIREWVYANRTWQGPGHIDGLFKTAPYSKLSAISSVNNFGEWMRVYYQDSDTRLREAAWNPTYGTWVNGTDALPSAFPGTSISAVTSPFEQAQNSTNLYYQDHDLSIREMLFRNRAWSPGHFQATINSPAWSSISSTFTPSGQYKVFSLNEVYQIILTQSAIDPNNMHSPTPTTWSPSTVLSNLNTTITNSSISAITLEEDKLVRLFYQPIVVRNGSWTCEGYHSVAEGVEYDGVNWEFVRFIHPM